MKQDVLNLWTSPTLRLTYIQNVQLSEYFIKLSVRFASLSNFKGTLCSVSFMHFLIGSDPSPSPKTCIGEALHFWYFIIKIITIDFPYGHSIWLKKDT